MSDFCDATYTYYSMDHLPDYDNLTVNNRSTKRIKLRKYAIYLTCILVLTIIMTGVILILKQKRLNKKIKIILSTPKPIKHNISFNCQLPINPTYKKNCTIVAGVLSTSNDKLNELNGPTSVYLDREKNIYVADTTNHRIRKYSSENSNTSETLIDETSNINYPRCLFIDQESNYLFFLDQDNQGYYRVQLLKLNSNPLKSTILVVGNQTRSYGMSLDEDFNIYVSEYNNHRIVKWLSPNYNNYLIIVVENQLTYPKSIYIDQKTNNLYVADKNRIQCWINNSNKSQIVMQGGSVCPNAIEYDCHGNLYISQDRTIKLINQNTGLPGIDIIGIQSYSQWVQNFRKNDDFSYPEGIYLDKTNGDLYVTDSSFNLIEKFTIEF
ncbi:unnamed protein product [Adineta steineri]|uniref:NHL repeat containing protein n=1 Tax=Adineta steineri TaxID=433720 RepID=A0A815GEN5_9BILA|nr:unnamed protein product [Adineta steineri]CAF1334585.1 unnamed protein product [Adineta steineri]CAF1338528.1 unnamed protein product [Adineta steineri]